MSVVHDSIHPRCSSTDPPADRKRRPPVFRRGSPQSNRPRFRRDRAKTCRFSHPARSTHPETSFPPQTAFFRPCSASAIAIASGSRSIEPGLLPFAESSSPPEVPRSALPIGRQSTFHPPSTCRSTGLSRFADLQSMGVACLHFCLPPKSTSRPRSHLCRSAKSPLSPRATYSHPAKSTDPTRSFAWLRPGASRFRLSWKEKLLVPCHTPVLCRRLKMRPHFQLRLPAVSANHPAPARSTEGLSAEIRSHPPPGTVSHPARHPPGTSRTLASVCVSPPRPKSESLRYPLPPSPSPSEIAGCHPFRSAISAIHRESVGHSLRPAVPVQGASMSMRSQQGSQRSQQQSSGEIDATTPAAFGQFCSSTCTPTATDPPPFPAQIPGPRPTESAAPGSSRDHAVSLSRVLEAHWARTPQAVAAPRSRSRSSHRSTSLSGMPSG